MNHGPLIFVGVYLAMALSWLGMVFVPQVQLGRLEETTVPPAGERYPTPRSGVAQQGRETYRANGCFYCHTQQARSEVRYDVVLANAGTNTAALIKAVRDLNIGLSPTAASRLVASAPAPLLTGLREMEAANLVKSFEDAKKSGAPDAKVNIVVDYIGADIWRGWGTRHGVALDYLYDRPVMLGHSRIGADLANIGSSNRWVRILGPSPGSSSDTNLLEKATQEHLRHLYNPQITAKGSTMPPYSFLFEKRKTHGKPSPDALKLPGEFAAEAGYEIFPKPEALALVAYLQSLQSDVSVFEGPLPAPPKKPGSEGATNEPPSGATATNPPAAIPSQAK